MSSIGRGLILVVDDEEPARYSLARTLRAEGYVVIEGACGNEALELARRFDPDLVLLDVRLPDILGYRVTEVLKADARTRTIAILQVSASFTSADAQAQGLARGADGYLTHPIDPQILSATVQALLRLRQAERRERQARERAEALEREARALADERERLLVQMQEEARRKNEFLAVLSHELRNPLTPIRNSIYLLGRVAPGSDQATRAREVLDRQTVHLTRLVDDLLDVTRIAHGKIRVERERLDLRALVRRAVEDHREEFSRAGLHLELDEAGEAPLPVDGDRTRLAQVVGNLLQNAVKFTPAGGLVALSLDRVDAPAAPAGGVDERGEVVGAPRAPGPLVAVARLRVADSGAGMTSEMLARLFEPFVQGDRTLEKSRGGLGLGLALARGIVELHGGTIEAASEGPGRGSTFTVRLPLDPPPALDLRDDGWRQPAPSPPTSAPVH